VFGSLERSQQLLAYCSQIPESTNTTPRTFVSQKIYTRCWNKKKTETGRPTTYYTICGPRRDGCDVVELEHAALSAVKNICDTSKVIDKESFLFFRKRRRFSGEEMSRFRDAIVV